MHHRATTTASIGQVIQHQSFIQASRFILQHAIPQKEAQPNWDEKR